MLFEIATLIVALFALTYTYFQHQYNYFKRKNIPYLTPSFPFGSLGNPLNRKESIGVKIKILYDEMRAKKWQHGGFFTMATANYMPLNLDYVKNILTKDFQYFVDRGVYYNEKDDPLSAHLFALGGVKWRNLRMKLTPTFTSGKMKMMFNTLLECEKNLQQVMSKLDGKAIDIKEVLGCFTTDIIGSCAFGLECNTFKEDDSPFRRYGKKIFSASKPRLLLFALAINFPNLMRRLGVQITEKDVSDFFMKVVKDTVEYREKNNVTRNDFMQLLIELKNNKLKDDKNNVEYKHDGTSLTIEEVAAQAFIFFLAGFETSSTTSTFVLYELAKHQDIQDKVRQEIEQVLKKHQGKITYESIQDMKYMNQVIDETLRKYPPVPFITRLSVKDYKMPDQDLIIEEGTKIIIPIYGIHNDPEYYPDPDKFDPDRFTEEMKASRHQYAHIPFGEGPRICIGLRFGIMQSKVALASLLKTYQFTVNKKTKEPLKMKVNSFVLAAEGEIWLDSHKI